MSFGKSITFLSGYCHTTISLICMSPHKASATRCLCEHQAWSRQPAIWALPQSPLRRLTLSVLFTSWSTSYQTTCKVSKRSSIKGTCQYKPTWSSSFALWQFQCCRLYRSFYFWIWQPKQNWQHCYSCIVERSWKILLCEQFW